MRLNDKVKGVSLDDSRTMLSSLHPDESVGVSDKEGHCYVIDVTT